MEVYLRGEDLRPDQLDLIQLYLRQYIERAVLASGANRPKLLSQVEKLRRSADIERFADELSEWGIEPF